MLKYLQAGVEKTRSNPLPARGHSAILLSNTRISHIFLSNISLLASAISSWNSNFIAKVSSQKTIESVRILFMLPSYKPLDYSHYTTAAQPKCCATAGWFN